MMQQQQQQQQQQQGQNIATLFKSELEQSILGSLGGNHD
jgi:hypothetical protein